MKLTRKNLKMTKKTLFSFKKRGDDPATVLTGDPISVTVTTVVFTTY